MNSISTGAPISSTPVFRVVGPEPINPELSLDEMLDRAEAMRLHPRPVKDGEGGYDMLCPLHDDHAPSLNLDQGEDGQVLAYCHPCEAERSPGDTREQWVIRLFAKFRDPGLVVTPRTRELRQRRRPDHIGPIEREYIYYDADGKPVARKARRTITDGERGTTRRTFTWYRALPYGDGSDYSWIAKLDRPVTELPLYGIQLLRAAIANGVTEVCITEGESDQGALTDLRCVAVCPPNGSGEWAPAWTAEFDGLSKVFIYADNDDKGLGHAEKVRAALSPVVKEVAVLLSPYCNDVREHLEAGHTLNEFVIVEPDPNRWPDLIPIDEVRALPPFPTEVLPGWVREQVEAVAASTHTPPGLVGMVALGVLSAALCGRYDVRIRPDWTEPAHLFLLVGLASGSRKSAVFRMLCEPIEKAETTLVNGTATERAEAELEVKIAAKRLDKGIALASQVKAKASTPSPKASALNTTADDKSNGNKGFVDTDALAKALRAAQDNLKPCPRLVCDDSTPERLADLIATYGHIALLSSEGGSIVTATGKRYSERSHLDLLLKAHAGDAHRVDRKSAETVVIPRAALTLVATVQPVVLADLASDTELRERGLLARFLICLPPDLVGGRPFDAEDVPESVKATWNRRVQEMAERTYRSGPRTINVDSAGVRVLADLHVKLESRMGNYGDLYDARDWTAKAVGAAARIGTVLALADDSAATAVRHRYIEAGATIVTCLAEHFLYVLDGAGVNQRTTDARKLWRWVTKSRAQVVTVRDMRRGVPALCREPGEPRLRRALDALTEAGYLRRAAPEPEAQRGRPSERYEVRPAP